MKKVLYSFLALYASWFLVTTTIEWLGGGATVITAESTTIKKYNVLLKDGAAFTNFTATVPEVGTYERALPQLSMITYSVTPAEAEVLRAQPGVVSVEESRTLQIHVSDPLGGEVVDVATLALSDHEHITGEKGEIIPPGVQRVGALDAWSKGVTGQGVKVCVIDTGVDPNHPDIATAISASRNFSATGNAKGDDDHGHGTHVAGTIAGQMKKGSVVGVAPNAKILSAKVCTNKGQCEDDDIAAGIVWCVNSGARVLSLSLGEPTANATLQRAVEFAQSKKVIVSASAGNSGGSIGYPARFPGVYAWGANGTVNGRNDDPSKPFDADALASFSSRGPELFGTAPGVYVLSAKMGGGHVKFSGTSMACPHGSGVIALLISKYPDATPEQIREAMSKTSTRLPADACNSDFGCGVPQAGAALNRLGRYIRK